MAMPSVFYLLKIRGLMLIFAPCLKYHAEEGNTNTS